MSCAQPRLCALSPFPRPTTAAAVQWEARYLPQSAFFLTISFLGFPFFLCALTCFLVFLVSPSSWRASTKRRNKKGQEKKKVASRRPTTRVPAVSLSFFNFLVQKNRPFSFTPPPPMKRKSLAFQRAMLPMPQMKKNSLRKKRGCPIRGKKDEGDNKAGIVGSCSLSLLFFLFVPNVLARGADGPRRTMTRPVCPSHHRCGHACAGEETPSGRPAPCPCRPRPRRRGRQRHDLY